MRGNDKPIPYGPMPQSVDEVDHAPAANRRLRYVRNLRSWRLSRHRRFTFHFTPASWMNQVETWFSVLTRQALRRDSFESIPAAHIPHTLPHTLGLALRPGRS